MKLHPLVLALGLIPLAGCNDPNGIADSGSDKPITYSVRAVDGYLRNALVWLDKDGDFQLDNDEPSTLSGEGGLAELDVSNIDNPELYSVVVKAIASQTIDEDSITDLNPNGSPTQASFMMSAPAGQTVVTPLSTLVNIKMTNGLDQDEAVSEVAEDLDIEETDLLGDYIADKKGDIAAKANGIVELAVLPKTGEQMQEMSQDDTDFDNALANDIDTVKDLTAEQRLVKDENGAVSVEANTDTDGDGVIDAKDAFFENPLEWLDTDKDGTGNNADLDDDGDKVNDEDDAFPLDETETVDTDKDGTGNNADLDDDGDGVNDEDDAFSLDKNETVDTDGDEIGNNADPDDDNDGLSDIAEVEKGTNPLLADTDSDGVNDLLDALPLDNTETVDTDGNGIGNNADLDDDGDGLSDIAEADKGTNPLLSDTDSDGVNDLLDVFPLNNAETVDTDGNGIGNNADPDDDNDGLSDIAEAEKGTNPLLSDTDDDGVNDLLDDLPLDETETVDTDGDSIGNNADPDDDDDGLSDIAEAEKGTNPLLADTDNDGVNDADDAFPLDDSETTDENGNGIGDNADALPLIGTWSDVETSFTFNADMTYAIEVKVADDELEGSSAGIETGSYTYDKATGVIAVAEITSDNNGTAAFSGFDDSSIFKLVSTDNTGSYLTFSYQDDSEQEGEFVMYKTLPTSASAFITANSNFTFFDSEEGEFSYEDITWNSSDYSISFTEYAFNFATLNFEAVIDDGDNSDHGDYILTDAGWGYADEGDEALTPQEDGSIVYSNNIETETGTGKEWQLSGANITQFLGTVDAEESVLAVFDDTVDFSEGASVYEITWTSSAPTPVYSLYLYGCEQPGGFTDLEIIEVADTGLCNSMLATMTDTVAPNEAVKTIAQIKASTHFVEGTLPGEFAGMYWGHDGAIRLVNDGTVDIYNLKWGEVCSDEHGCDGVNQTSTIIPGEVTWQEVTVNGKILITFNTEEESLSYFNNQFLTEIDGYVRFGEIQGVNDEDNEAELMFNDVAKQDILDAVIPGGPAASSLIGYWGNEDITFQFNSDMTYIMEQLTTDDGAGDSLLGTESGHYQYNAATGRITVSSIIYDNNGTSGLSDSLLEPDYRFVLESALLNQSLTFYYIDDDESGSFTLNAINNPQRICSQNDSGEQTNGADYTAYLTAATNCGATQSFDSVTMEGLNLYHHGEGGEYQGYLFNGDGTGTYVENGGYSASFTWTVNNEGIMAINSGGDLEYFALIASYDDKYNVLSFYTWDENNTAYSEIIGQEFTTDEPVISDINLASLYNAGLNWFWAELGDDWKELEYGSITRSEQGAVTEVANEYDFDADEFVTELITAENSARDNKLVLEHNGEWKPRNNAKESMVANPDGSLTVNRLNGIGFSNNVTGATEINLAGVNIASQLANTDEDGAWAAFVIDSAVFTEGAIAYNVRLSSIDYYQLESHEWWCDEVLTKEALGGICNSIQPSQSNSPIASFDALKAEKLAVDWHHISGDIYNDITMKLNAGGTVSFWEWESQLQNERQLAAGTWQEITVNGETLIEVVAPQSVASLGDHFNDDGTLYFAEVSGFIRQVWKESKGGQELLFNNVARDNIIAALDVSLTESPLIGFWANEYVSFQFNADMTYVMEQLISDDATLGTESGVYHYDADSGRITVSSLIYDNNGTSGLSDSLLEPDYRFVLQSYERDISLTFSYIDDDESGVFTLTASTSGQPAVPDQFSADFLAGKTFYPVWFGIAEVDGAEVDNVTAVAEIAFDAQGTSADYRGILIDNDAGNGNFLVTGGGRLYEIEDGSDSGYEISDCGSATHFIHINYIDGGVFDNAELWFYDKDAALAYAAQLNQSIQQCTLN